MSRNAFPILMEKFGPLKSSLKSPLINQEWICTRALSDRRIVVELTRNGWSELQKCCSVSNFNPQRLRFHHTRQLDNDRIHLAEPQQVRERVEAGPTQRQTLIFILFNKC